MINSYVFCYIESNIVCSIFLLILLVRTVRGVDWQLKQTYFAKVLFFYITYCLFDICWICFEFGIFKNQLLFFVFNIFNYIIGSFSTYYWYIYSEIVQGGRSILLKKRRRLLALPLWVIIISSTIFLILLDFVYKKPLNRNYYFYYYLITTVTPILYIVLAFGKSIMRIHKKQHLENKSIYISMAFYPIILFIGGILQLFFLYIPILCFVISIALLCVYLSNLDNLISVDALTKLNNRNQFNKFIFKSSKERDGKKWLYFIDVDKFKRINDTYGHVEGDKALILISNVLRSVCRNNTSKYFIARYGGDEFIVIANDKDITNPNELKKSIEKNLKEKIRKNNIPYEITVSIGITHIDFKNESIEECLKKADCDLYKEKKIKEKRPFFILSSENKERLKS